MMLKILLLMILCHILDDFVLQKATLSNLKQREWWEREIGTKEYGIPLMYKNDYKMALVIHALSWSIMIHLPLFIFDFEWYWLLISVASNCLIHYIVDNAKANLRSINLIQDQIIHFGQILLTFTIYSSLIL